jgi:mRNA interferase MazF
VSLRFERGAVVTVRFDPAVGSEIRKTRPAVVVSNNIACRLDSVVQVVPLTALPDRRLRPFESQVGSAESGLEKASRLLPNQIRTISRRRIGAVIGRIDRAETQALDQALRVQLGL